MINKYEIRGDVTVIYVKHKNETLETSIDTVDLQKAQEFNNSWYARWDESVKTYYVNGVQRVNGKQKSYKLHRWITDAPKGMVVDHFDHNGLNNKRSTNLRVVTNAQNGQNRKSAYSTNKTSGIRGVHWHKKQKKWNAALKIENKVLNLGSFDDLKEAEKAVKAARSKYMPFSLDALETSENSELIIIKKRKRAIKQSGIQGVRWHSNSKKWQVVIRSNKKDIHIGLFENVSEAEIALNKAKIKHLKESS